MTTKKRKQKAKFIQIVTGQWQPRGETGMSFVVIALDSDGKVFKFVGGRWTPIEGVPPYEYSSFDDDLGARE